MPPTKFTLALLLVLFCFSSLAFSQDSSTSTITKCRHKDRLGKFCSLVVEPVCGYKPDIVCTGSPCNYITYSNACEACHDRQVASYTKGKCPQTIVPPPLLPPPIVPPPLIPPIVPPPLLPPIVPPPLIPNSGN